MNALELAECFELYAIDHNSDGFPAIRQGTLNSAAEMLRKQHEAIKQLREALRMSAAALEVRSAFGDADLANVTLESTKDFVK